MQFDPNNRIVQLCVEGMEMENTGKRDEAEAFFLQAWIPALSFQF